MSRTVFVDASRTASDGKKGRKPHAGYDGERTFKIHKLTELKDYDEIFIDTLSPEIYDEILELLRKDVRVYLLKDITKLKRLRIENNLEKSDENDAMLLSRIPREKFRPLAIEELELKMKTKPLINKYEQIMKWKNS